jgi:hypothetical protein
MNVGYDVEEAKIPKARDNRCGWRPRRERAKATGVEGKE